MKEKKEEKKDNGSVRAQASDCAEVHESCLAIGPPRCRMDGSGDPPDLLGAR